MLYPRWSRQCASIWVVVAFMFALAVALVFSSASVIRLTNVNNDV